MAQSTSGNKMSLRSTSMNQIKRVAWISNHLGALGDLLTSTFKSILLAAAVAVLPIILDFLIAFKACGGATASKNIAPFVLVIIGTLLLAINVLMINPSQGSQIMVSFKYLNRVVNDSHMRELREIKPYRFYKKAHDKTILETKYKRQRRYISVFRVQGAVSKTSFAGDLEILRNLQRDLFKTMDRDTVRTTINFIGIPKIKRKRVAANATPEMKARAYDLAEVIKQLDGMQILKTYVVLSNRSPRNLQKEVDNHMNYFGKGLTVTSKLLSGNELKRTIHSLFS